MHALPTAFVALLQSGPVPPDAGVARQLTLWLLIVLLAARALVGPAVYFAARKRSDGREVWWGALATLTPLIGGIAFLIARPRPPPPAIAPWNPWILCPYCALPRGYTPQPCYRCGQLLPPPGYGFPPPPPPPPPPPAPRFRSADIGTVQVVGAIAFTFILSSVVLFLGLTPQLTNPAVSQAELDAMENEPSFVLLAILLQDSIMVAIAFDQARFRGRLSLKEMGFTWNVGAMTPARQIGLGVLAGVLTFVVSTVAVQTLIDILHAAGEELPSGGSALNPRVVSLSDYGFWLASGVVVAPIAEEIFFRGYALSGFLQRGDVSRGLLVTSALFGAVHLNMISFGPLMAAGYVLGYLRWKTGSLSAPIAAHATNNFIVMTLTFWGL